MRTLRLTLVGLATLLLGAMSGAALAQAEPTDPMAPAAAETGYPILEIVFVEAEPVPWVRQGVTKTKPQGTGCDFFRIRLTFTISNRGTADFPPEGVAARLDRGGKLFWTVLYGGDGTREPRETGQTAVYSEYSFWYHNELDIPEGGVAKIVREFPVPTDVPLNEFTVVAWFAPPMTQYAGPDNDERPSRVKSGRTTRRSSEDSAPPSPTSLLDSSPSPVAARPIRRPSPPPAMAPPIRQTITRDGHEEVAVELVGAPFRSSPMAIAGPDLRPLAAIWVEDDKPDHYDTVLVYENRGTEAIGSLQLGMGVSYVGTSESMGWSHELPGPFPPGLYCAVVHGEHAMQEPDFSTNRARVSLRCPLPGAVGADAVSLGDVDLSNDWQEFPDTRARDESYLLEATSQCQVALYVDPDR